MAQWAKGVSGNPGGRPAGYGDLREIAQQHTPEAIALLVTILNDEKASASARVSAATALLDRGWGRPPQTIHANLGGEESLQDLLQRLSERRRRDTQAFQAESGTA